VAEPFVEDLQFYHRLKWVQRAGRALMFAIVVAALAGLFGAGPLSHGVSGDPSAVWAEYDRYARYHAPTDIVLHVERGLSENIEVHLREEFVNKLEIQAITPAPLSQRSGDGKVVFSFKAEKFPAAIHFRARHEEYGSVPVEVSLGSGESLSFTTFVYP